MEKIETYPSKGDKWWVSHLNFIDEVRNRMHPRGVLIHDTTLRDGEQTAGVVLDREDKMKIATKLDEIGVHRIEAGMPVVSSEEMKSVKSIAGMGLTSKIYALCRGLKGDIDAAINCDVHGIILEFPVGYPKLRYQFNWTEEEVVSKAIEHIDYAKDHGLSVTFFGVDSTRAHLNFLKKLFATISEEAHVDGITIVDTYACLMPQSIYYMTRELKNSVQVPIEVHCHNDFGLAVANTLSALCAGAEVAHTTVNGMGERCGNAALEEVALSLYLLYGLDTGLKYGQLCRISRLVERLTKFKISLNKPIVGKYAFTRESGIAVDGWSKYFLGSEAFLPDLIGNTHRVVIGKKSGKKSIVYKLEELGITVPEELIPEILQIVKSEAERKKAAVSDKEFKKIIDQLCKYKNEG